MIFLNLSRSALGACIAGALLTSCSPSNSSLSQSTAFTASLPRGAQGSPLVAPAGGPFTAKYTGTYATGSCGPGCGAEFVFGGNGSASFLGASKESAVLYANGGPFSGQDTLKSTRTPANTIIMQLSSSGYPCYSKVSWTATGGTGKFSHASGSGTLTFACATKYTDHWTGKLHY